MRARAEPAHDRHPRLGRHLRRRAARAPVLQGGDDGDVPAADALPARRGGDRELLRDVRAPPAARRLHDAALPAGHRPRHAHADHPLPLAAGLPDLFGLRPTHSAGAHRRRAGGARGCGGQPGARHGERGLPGDDRVVEDDPARRPPRAADRRAAVRRGDLDGAAARARLPVPGLPAPAPLRPGGGHRPPHRGRGLHAAPLDRGRGRELGRVHENGRRVNAANAISFMRRLRAGLDSGLELPEALTRGAAALPRDARETLERIVDRLEGDYSEDEWGFDEDFAELVEPFFAFLYDSWWRVSVEGAERVPAHGGALLTSNHAGILPWDATMISMALLREHPLPRHPRFLVLDWAFDLPWVSSAIRKVGGVVASPFNALRLLEQDQLVAVFPEGVKGTGKPFSERYRLQRFGRGGFVEVALRTGAPIVPVAGLGREEIYPKLAESRALARVIGAPFVPITPTFPWLGPLGLIPLPSRWRIEFCEPIDLSEHPPEAADDRQLVFDLSEQVRELIQNKLYENLVLRGSAFL